MIRRAWVALLVGSVCFGLKAEAADIPFSTLEEPAMSSDAPKPRKKTAKKPVKAAAAKAVRKAAKPTNVATPEVPTVEEAEVAVNVPDAPSPVPEAKPETPAQAENMELAWFLEPLVANADGPKGEGSSSIEGNLIVSETGYATSSHMKSCLPATLSKHLILWCGWTCRWGLPTVL